MTALQISLHRLFYKSEPSFTWANNNNAHRGTGQEKLRTFNIINRHWRQVFEWMRGTFFLFYWFVDYMLKKKITSETTDATRGRALVLKVIVFASELPLKTLNY